MGMFKKLLMNKTKLDIFWLNGSKPPYHTLVQTEKKVLTMAWRKIYNIALEGKK